MIHYSHTDNKGSKQGLLYCFEPIGFVESPFKDKYGIPRQPSLAIAAKGKIKFKNDPDLVMALKTIEQFSHLWVIFVFHEHGGKNWKPSVRPPRLGGRQKVGVLASRSPHRPNPIGMSAVKIDAVHLEAKGGPEIHIAGLDLLDGTPVLDVKPYIPYADQIPEAKPGWAEEPVEKFPVYFSDVARENLKTLAEREPELQNLVVQILEIDPRPAYQKREFPIASDTAEGLQYGIEIGGFEVKYEIRRGALQVLRLYKP